MVPLGAVTPLFGAHIGGTATANIWTTGALALSSLGMWLINGVRLGGRAFFAHLNPGPWWLAPLMVPLEIFGFFAKTFALAVRLFANMMAGHTVLAVLLSFILGLGSAVGAAAGLGVAVPVVAFSVALSLLELFVAVLQAFIFTFLTSLFLGMFTVFHHGEEHARAHGH
jgi:F-type H+-transporting ATPase subunit a